MQREPKFWLALLLFLVVLLSLSTLVQILIWASLLPSRESLAPFFATAVASQVAYLAARFWFWRLARHGRGAPALLWSAVIGSVALAVPFLLGRLIDSGVGSAIPQSAAWAVALGAPIVDAFACLLFAIGLWRSQLAPRWIAVVGAMAAIEPLGWVQRLLFRQSPPVVDALGWVLTSVFLVALALSLLRGPADNQVTPAA